MTRLLLIEDNPGGLLALTGALQTHLKGVQVDATSSAEEGLDWMAHHTYDAVICDVLLPGMDGLQFLRSVLGHQPELSVILITAGEFVREEEALGSGAFAFLPKPLDIDLVLKTVALALARTAILREARERRVHDLRPENVTGP